MWFKSLFKSSKSKMKCCAKGGDSSTEKKECGGPGYASPAEAINGPREKLIFITCPSVAVPPKPDMIAAVDLDPLSKTYSKVVGKLILPNIGDEVHHTGWNACSSCHSDSYAKRTYMIVPCLNSSRIYVIDTSEPTKLTLHKTIEASELQKLNVSFPHTSHCLADGTIMISTLGDVKGENHGSFLQLDGKTFNPIGTWPAAGQSTKFGYDFWYQPRHNVMISSEWGNPNKIKNGFHLKDVEEGHYADHVHIWDWKKKSIIQTIKLEGDTGKIPLECRFFHEPSRCHAFIGAALGSSIYHFYKEKEGDSLFKHRVAVSVAPKKVENWVLPAMPSLITDLIISMDDQFLYFSNWLHGDIRQYDIRDPFNFKLTGQVFIGGSLHTETGVKMVDDKEKITAPAPVIMKGGKKVEGGPQMLQLSLDGKRLYVTTSLYAAWDRQFYPGLVKHGAMMLQLDVDTEKGGMKLNPDFCVDFSLVDGEGPYLAHEMRYPGGDCTSDIWL